MASDENALNHMRREYSRFAEAAEEHGWEISFQRLEETYGGQELTRISVLVRRGDEEIYIFWVDGKLTVVPTYKFLGLETTLRNASAALRRMSEKPAAKQVMRVKRKAQRRGLLAGDVGLADLVRDLPWEPDEMTDPELLKALYGKTVIWENGITKGLEEDTIRPVINFDKMKYHTTRSSAGRRIVSFMGNTGYRSFAVEQLLRVV